MRKFFFRLGVSMFTLLALVVGWFYFFVIANPDRLPDPSQIEVKKVQNYYERKAELFSLDFPLLSRDKISNKEIISVLRKYHYANPEPFLNNDTSNTIFNIGLGKSAWYKESKKAIGVYSNQPIQWKVSFSQKSKLVISLASFPTTTFYNGKNLTAIIKVDGKTLVEAELLPEIPTEFNEKSWWWEPFGQFIHVQSAIKGGNWKNMEIELPTAGNEITIEFKGDEKIIGLIGRPEIWSLADIEKRKKNIIVLQIDSLNPDEIFEIGRKRPTPVLDSLIVRGTYFENNSSNMVWTRPSTYSMFSGKLPPELMEFTHFSSPQYLDQRVYRSGLKPLPRYLQEKGYVTSAIANNLFLKNSSEIGLDYGFQELFDTQRDFYDAVEVTENAIHYIQRNQDKPFVLFLNYNNPHFTFKPPIKYSPDGFLDYLTDDQHDLYYGEVRFTENYLKMFLDKFYELGLDEHTLLIMNADHGALFDDHPRHRRYMDVVGFNGTIDEDRMHVPLLFIGPNIPKNQRIYPQTQLIDLPPTVLSYLGYEIPKLYDGNNLLPGIYSPNNFKGTDVVFQFARELRAVRYKNKWKLTVGNLPVYGIEELYDLTSDPKEHHNLVLLYPDTVAFLKKYVDKYLEKRRPLVYELTMVNEDTINTKIIQIKSKTTLYDLFSVQSKIIDTIITIQPMGIFVYPLELGKDSLFQVELFENGKHQPINWIQGIKLTDAEIKLTHNESMAFITPRRQFPPGKGMYLQIVPAEYWHLGGFQQGQISSGVKDVLKSWGYIH